MKRIRKIDSTHVENSGYGTFISFDEINYSIYRKQDGEVVQQVFLTVEDIETINDFVFICEKQSLGKEE